MSEDPTRALPMPGPQAREIPAYGRVGPADPHADPATHPGLRPADVDGPATDPGIPVVQARPEPPTVPTAQPGPPTPPVVVRPDPVVRRTRTGGLWTGLVFSALVLVFLLVFILQNLDPVRITFLGFSGSLPVGVALLLAAIAGLLLVAVPATARMLQLRRAARRAAKR
jgi:uncharacterized integral membrane protein